MELANRESNSLVIDSARHNRDLYQPYKRALDVTLCLLTLPFLLLLMGLIALCVVLDSSGSPFFVQERVGQGGRRFRMYKFRTMRADYDDAKDRAYMQSFVVGQTGDSQAPGQDAINKPIRTRDITRVGRFLRKASLDELPQLANVMKGEMSLIGPRPNVPWEVESYKDWHLERLEALPGITGLAQVHGRSSLSFDDIVAYDVEYVRTLSFRVDLAILVNTIRVVFSGKGAL